MFPANEIWKQGHMRTSLGYVIIFNIYQANQNQRNTILTSSWTSYNNITIIMTTTTTTIVIIIDIRKVKENVL